MLSSILHLQTVTEAITETDKTDTSIVEVRVGDVYPEAPKAKETKKGKTYMSPTKCSAAKRRPNGSGSKDSSPRHDKTLDLSQVTVGRQRMALLQKAS